MKFKNKRFPFAAVLAVLVIGIFAFRTYTDRISPYDEEYSISTPDYTELEAAVFNDPQVPLGPEASTEAVSHPYVQKVIDLVNAERSKANLAPLTALPELCISAQVRADEIETLFSHSRPDGTKYLTVFEETGVSYTGCGENLAYGYRTPEAVVEGWMNSEGHKANILNPNFLYIGIGYQKSDVNGYHYWAQHFTF